MEKKIMYILTKGAKSLKNEAVNCYYCYYYLELIFQLVIFMIVLKKLY